jgi:ribosomal protein S18 acetylase RimI-like enzyme
MPVRVATPDDRSAILAGLDRRPWFAAPCRPYPPEQVKELLRQALERQIDELLDHPAVDLLVHDEDGVHEWAIVQHDIEESVTGATISLVRDPSWATSPPLLLEAARRARQRGATRLGIDVYQGDERQAGAAGEAGLSPEYHRIVCNLDLAPPVASTVVSVDPATENDRVFLVALSTECVPFMFCADRKDEIEQVRARFFDVYGALDLASGDLEAWVARVGGEPAGAVLVHPDAQAAADGRSETYIYDISVLPEHWGARVAVALVDRLISETRERGGGYLTGDISVDNERVRGLSERYRFVPEHTRWFRRLC